MAERYYPVGIQTFRKIIEGGYLYIDKTDLIWHLQNKRNYYFGSLLHVVPLAQHVYRARVHGIVMVVLFGHLFPRL